MKRYIKSAGYYKYSMSNNAVDAYANGEMPLSKWTKSAIIRELQELGVSSDVIEKAKTLSLADLKAIFLYKSSWHHTSKMYNRTNFYSVNELVTIADIQSYLNSKGNASTLENQIPLYRVYYRGNLYYGVSPNGMSFRIYDNGELRKLSFGDIRASDIELLTEIPSDAKEIYNILVGSL